MFLIGWSPCPRHHFERGDEALARVDVLNRGDQVESVDARPGAAQADVAVPLRQRLAVDDDAAVALE